MLKRLDNLGSVDIGANPVRVVTESRIANVPAKRWNQLFGTHYPFLRHEFLHSLEASGSVGPDAGWQPCHQLLYANGDLVAALPLYLKTHSWGEYVFDWSWANAYQRHGLDYYPKLVCAIPFTPAAGPRIGLSSSADQSQIIPRVVSALDALTESRGASSWHVLFPQQQDRALLGSSGLLDRLGLQYHWINRGYRDFDDYLGSMTSRKRKMIKRERRLVEAQGLELERATGADISTELWDQFYRFYQITYARRSGHGGYLTKDFFLRCGETMAEQIMLAVAYKGTDVVAAALNFIGNDALYGRYWGCLRDYDQLHFETCYYQGIEFCIERGLNRFDAGAQGEHKLARGFEPAITHSLHRIVHPQFRRAIASYLDQESAEIAGWAAHATGLLPFRHDNERSK